MTFHLLAAAQLSDDRSFVSYSDHLTCWPRSYWIRRALYNRRPLDLPRYAARSEASSTNQGLYHLRRCSNHRCRRMRCSDRITWSIHYRSSDNFLDRVRHFVCMPRGCCCFWKHALSKGFHRHRSQVLAQCYEPLNSRVSVWTEHTGLCSPDPIWLANYGGHRRYGCLRLCNDGRFWLGHVSTAGLVHLRAASNVLAHLGRWLHATATYGSGCNLLCVGRMVNLVRPLCRP